MEKKYTKTQRVLAMAVVIIIFLLYLSTLVLALLKYSWAKDMFKIALGCTLVLPILAWLYIWLIGKVTHKHTIADFDIGGKPTQHPAAMELNETEDTK